MAKLNLDQIRVESFITSMDAQSLFGGRRAIESDTSEPCELNNSNPLNSMTDCH